MESVVSDDLRSQEDRITDMVLCGSVIALCNYCGSELQLSKVEVPRIVQAGARDLGFFDIGLFVCCPKCLHVPRTSWSAVLQFEVELTDSEDLYLRVTGANRSVSLLAVREGMVAGRVFIDRQCSAINPSTVTGFGRIKR